MRLYGADFCFSQGGARKIICRGPHAPPCPLQKRAHEEARLVGAVSLVRADRAGPPRQAARLHAIRPGGASQMARAGGDVIAVGRERPNRARFQTPASGARVRMDLATPPVRRPRALRQARARRDRNARARSADGSEFRSARDGPVRRAAPIAGTAKRAARQRETALSRQIRARDARSGAGSSGRADRRARRCASGEAANALQPSRPAMPASTMVRRPASAPVRSLSSRRNAPRIASPVRSIAAETWARSTGALTGPGRDGWRASSAAARARTAPPSPGTPRR